MTNETQTMTPERVAASVFEKALDFTKLDTKKVTAHEWKTKKINTVATIKAELEDLIAQQCKEALRREKKSMMKS